MLKHMLAIVGRLCLFILLIGVSLIVGISIGQWVVMEFGRVTASIIGILVLFVWAYAEIRDWRWM